MRFKIPAAGGRQELVIESPAAANLNYFLLTDLTPQDSATAINKQTSVRAHSRRSYPGDSSPSSVSASAREFLADAGRKSGNALGGYTFTLVGDPGEINQEKRSFTLVSGRLMDLHAFLTSNAAMMLYLYGQSGARYTISSAATP